MAQNLSDAESMEVKQPATLELSLIVTDNNQRPDPLGLWLETVGNVFPDQGTSGG